MSEHTKGELGLSANHLNILASPTEKNDTYIPIAKMQYESWMDDNDYPMNLETAMANAERLGKFGA